MKSSKYFFILLFSINLVFSQGKIKVGAVAPKINITNYIENTPDNLEINKHYKVLEFWATWCKPCLEEVPKLNELQNKFLENKNLIFISITKEPKAKVDKLLKKIKFNSIVVSDTTGKTEKDFIEKDDGSFSIPQTILIDDKNIIRWIGTPNQLNQEIINKFINNENIEVINNSIIENTSPKIIKEDENPVESIFGIIQSKEIKNLFTIIQGTKDGFKGTINMLEESGIYFDANNDLKAIISNLIDIPKKQIIVNDDYSNNYLTIVYKNDKTQNFNNLKNNIKELLLNNLNLKAGEKELMTEVFVLKIIDSKKLIESNSDKTNEVILNNKANFEKIELYSLTRKISDYKDVIVVDETGLIGKYDFDLNFSDFKTMQEDFKKYGIELVKEKKKVRFYYFN